MNDLAREAFEQWYLREIDGDPEELATEVDGEYFFHVPRTAWRAWQATPEPDHIGGANKRLMNRLASYSLVIHATPKQMTRGITAHQQTATCMHVMFAGLKSS